METATATKSNQQIVQQAINEFLKGNIPAVIDACTDDIEWGSYPNPEVPFASRYNGKTEVMEFFTKLGGSVEFSVFEPYEFIAQGDRVIVLGRQAGTVKSTGKTYSHDWCFDFKMNNGKIQRFFAYVDTRDQAQAFNP